MNNENVFQEWQECRNTIGRFDGYLFRIRILGFSIFLAGLTAIATITTKVEKLSPLIILGSLIVFCFLLVTVYVLDRYYERMLLVAVNRASGLESHYLEGFQIGLTTEIEFYKNEPIRASFKVNFMYSIMFILVTLEYFSVVLYAQVSKFYLLPILIVLIVSAVVIYLSNLQLKKPNEAIELRGRIVKSPIIASKREIETVIQIISDDINDWFISAPGKVLNVITILEGGRRFSESIVERLKENYNISINLHNIKIASTTSENNMVDPNIEWGKIKTEEIVNNPTIIIDDIIHHGNTIKFAKKLVENENSTDVKVAVMINRYDKNANLADFIGIDLGLKLNDESENKWLFGYGMDISGSGAYRNIDHIGWADKG